MDVKNMSNLNNGWILCPSKSFPGKFYYFNVLNGKAVWCLNENEKARLDSRFNVQKANKYYNYPEPTTPPNNSPTNIPSNILPNTWPDDKFNRISQNGFQIANHAAYFQPHKPYIWIPIQLPFWPYISPDYRRPVLETRLDTVNESYQVDNEIFVQSSGIPLDHRFVNYEPTSLTLKINNELISAPPLKHSNSKTEPSQTSVLKYRIPNTESSELFSNLNSRVATNNCVPKFGIKTNIGENQILKNSKSFLDEESQSIINISQLCLNDSPNTGTELPKNQIPNYIPENSPMDNITSKSKFNRAGSHKIDNSQKSLEKKEITLNSYDKIQNSIANEIYVQDTIPNNLCNNDLRLVLLAKKRKSQADGVNGNFQTKRHKPQEITSLPKKKVTFNLENLGVDNEGSETHLQASPNKNFGKIQFTPNTNERNILLQEENPISNISVNTNQLTTANYIYTIKVNNTVEIKDTEKPEDNDVPSTMEYIWNNEQVMGVLPNCSPKKITPTKADDVRYASTFDGCSLNYCTANNKQIHDSTTDPKENGVQKCNLPLKGNNTYVPLCNEPPNVYYGQNISLNDFSNKTQIKNTVTNTESNKVVIDMPLIYDNTPMEIIFKKKYSSKTVLPTTEKVSLAYTNKDIWYLVVDMDILLDHQLLIDEFIKKDDKCRLLIPHAVQTKIESICLGDCRGQQRVLVARQISRRMSGSHKQIIVEPLHNDEDTLNTTDNILKCCVRAMEDNYYVVLITNNSYLKHKAKRLEIRCYTPEDLKNGAIIKPKILSDLRKIKFTIDNKEIGGNTLLKNKTCSTNDISADKFKIEKCTDKKSDLLINITKSKNIQNISKDELNCVQIELNNNVNKLNLKDSANKSTIVSRKVNIQKQNIIHPIQLSDKIALNEIENHDKNTCKSPTQKSKTIICNYYQCEKPTVRKVFINSKDNSNSSIDVFHIENNLHSVNGHKNDTDLRQNIALTGKVNTGEIQKEKMIISNVLSPKLSKNYVENQISKAPSAIPSLNQIKKATVTPSSNNVSSETDLVRLTLMNPDQALENCLKKYSIPNIHIHHRIRTRMDEYICFFTQIMEELFNDILQSKLEYINKIYICSMNTRECLTCIKMLYDDAKLKMIIEILVKLLTQCTCTRAKIKLDTDPRDLMKIIGCGILLVETLKTILPGSHILIDCESYFESLLNNIKCSDINLDLDELCPPVVCRSENIDGNEIRRNFAKDKAYVLEYLKKHFKEWADVDVVSENLQNKKIKVVRMTGKHLNKVKINNNKAVSYIPTTDDDSNDTGETEMLRNIKKKDLEKNLSRFQHIPEAECIPVDVNSQQIFPKENPDINNTSQYFSQDKIIITNKDIEPKIIRNFENIYSRHGINTCVVDIPTHANTFFQNKDKNAPKMIVNLKKCHEYEDKIKNKEHLCLDLVGNSVTSLKTHNLLENVDESEDIVYNHSKHSKQNVDDDDCISTKSIILSRNNVSYQNNYYAPCKANGAGTVTKKNYSNSLKTNEIYGVRNGNNINYKTYNDVYATKSFDEDNNKNIDRVVNENQENANYEDQDYNNAKHNNDKQNNSYENNNYKDCGTLFDEGKEIDNNYEDCIDDLEGNNDDTKTELISKDDSTHDSGYENESIQAQTLVKTFLNELSFTFKAMYKFIYDFTTEIREETIHEDRKNMLCNEASRCLEDIVAIIQRLKAIIQRESNEDSILKNLLLHAGVEAANDKKITRYRQIVTKCLEQAQILESSIRIIVCITNDLNDIPYISSPICNNLSYVNIFE